MTLTARPAILGDGPWLFQLRNDPGTIMASRIQEAVTAHDHIAWLEQALTDPARRLIVMIEEIAEGGRAEAVATYRLDGVGADDVQVSVTVAPKWRGIGLGQEVIRLASEHAAREGAARVIAAVRRENVASLVAFLRCGFLIAEWQTEAVDSDGQVVNPLRIEVGAEAVIRYRCPSCTNGVPHHTNATGSIGGAEGRHSRYDLHVGEGGGLRECWAGDLWLAWERARGIRATRKEAR